MIVDQGELIEDNSQNKSSIDDESQFKNISLVLGSFWGALALTFLCFITYQFDFFRRDFDELIKMLSIIWSGYFVLLFVALTGLNTKLKDKTLATPTILWSTLTILWVTYYIDELHLAVMMLYLSAMLKGVFRYHLKDYVFSASLAVMGYLIIIFATLKNYPDLIDLKYELIQWAAFTLLVIGFVFINTEIGRIRERMKTGNSKLSSTLIKINDLAVTDELTGLYNRRHLMQTLKQHKAIAERDAYGFSICFFDLDFFKNINDTYGHSAGDKVLKDFSTILKNVTSDVDCCFRYGGEEFVLVLVGKDLNEAIHVANNIRVLVEDCNFDSIQKGLKVTASSGVTSFYLQEEIEHCLSRADQALYQAKNSGRNRVEARVWS